MTSRTPTLALDARADLDEGPAWDEATGTLLWVASPPAAFTATTPPPSPAACSS